MFQVVPAAESPARLLLASFGHDLRRQVLASLKFACTMFEFPLHGPYPSGETACATVQQAPLRTQSLTGF